MSTDSNLFHEAKHYIPGGVNSPVRAFKGTDISPVFIKEAKGAMLFDGEGKGYIDYICSWGAMILGHADAHMNQAIAHAASLGVSFGTATSGEVLLARELTRTVRGLEQVRLVNSGTEACMSAIRLARGYTGREYIVKFEGCYHGHADSLLVDAGSGALTHGNPSSAGVPDAFAERTIVLPYNDVDALLALFDEEGFNIAAVIVEPVAGNMGCVPGTAKFLQTLRSVCTECDAVLIFDEVMSGFRTALGGASSLYSIVPDLFCFGKVIGGGLPMAAFGGRRKIMQMLAPEGPVYQAGTLSGNPIAVAAAFSVLARIKEKGFYSHLGAITTELTQGLRKAASRHGVKILTHQVGGMWGIFFTDKESITSLADVQSTDTVRYMQFWQLMLEQGVYLAPSAYESGFVSIAHTPEIIQKTLTCAERAFAQIAAS